MSFGVLILRSLVRQRIRTGLTLLGITVGITTVVALGAITGGFGQTAGQIIHTGGANFMVVQKGAADLSFSTVSTAEWRSVDAVPGVAVAIGEAMHVTQVGGNPMFFAMGVRPDQLRLLKPDVVSGRGLSATATKEVVLGQGAANSLASGRAGWSRSAVFGCGSSASTAPATPGRTTAPTCRCAPCRP